MAPRLLSELFPWPFVGVVVLLVVLIFLTPNLVLSGGPAAGSLATQAQLTIDRPPGTNVTTFYVHGLGTVRYTQIWAALATNVTWPPPPSPDNWTWTNATNDSLALAAVFSTTANPVALNLTATYVDAAGATVVYWGLYEFYFGPATLETSALAVGLTVDAATPIGSLPITLLLASAAPGAVP